MQPLVPWKNRQRGVVLLAVSLVVEEGAVKAGWAVLGAPGQVGARASSEVVGRIWGAQRVRVLHHIVANSWLRNI
jgi:hypothetical protein